MSKRRERVCTECHEPIAKPRRDQFQHDGKCRHRAVRGVTKIIGRELAARVFARERDLLAPLEVPEPVRSRQRRKVCLDVTRAGGAVNTDTGEAQ